MISALLAASLLAACPDPPERGPVLVVSQPEARDPEIAARIESWVGTEAGGLEIVLLPPGVEVGEPRAGFLTRHALPSRQRAEVDGRALAIDVRGAPALALSGAGFGEWYATLFPSDGPARLAHALYEAHVTGAPIVTFGRVGSFVCGAGMVPRAKLARTPRDPHETSGVVARVGLALGVPALVDAEGWPVGDPLELLFALHETKVDLAFFLEGEVALLYEQGERRATVLGPGRVLAFELDGSRRMPRCVLEARVSVLARGDAYDLRRGRVVPAEGREPAGPEATAPGGESACALFLSAGCSAQPELAFPARGLRFDLKADEDTRLFADEHGASTLAGLAFDAHWE